MEKSGSIGRTGSGRTGFVSPWFLLGALIVALILSMLDRLALSAQIQDIKRSLLLTDGQLGLLQGLAFGLFYTVMGIPLGLLADRWSNRGTIILGYVVWSLSTFATGFSATLPQLLVARLGVGAGEAALSPAGYSLIRHYFPPKRLALAISTFQMGATIGSSLAFVLVGVLGAKLASMNPGSLPQGFAHWQLIFLCLGIVSFLFLPVLFGIREPPRDNASEPHAAVPRPALLPFLGRHVGIWIPAFLGISAILATVYSLMAWLPAVFAREFGWTTARFGPTYGLIVLVTGLVGMAAGGWITDHLNSRYDNRAYVLFPLVLAILILPLIAFLPAIRAPGSALVVAAIAQTLCFMPLGVMPAFIQIWAPRPIRGQMAAIYILFVNGVSLGVAPVIIGFLSGRRPGDAHALRAALAAVSSGMLLVSILLFGWLLLRGQHPRIEAEPLLAER